ncbi:hypothetical protein ACFLRZ_03765 [Bacteroidota bacterium]
MKTLNRIFADTENIVIFGVIIGFTIIIALLTNRAINRRLIKKARAQNSDITSFIFLKHFIIATIYFIGIGWGLLTLPITKTFAHSFLAGAGASTLIIGFASQTVLSNMVSGIFIIIQAI